MRAVARPRAVPTPTCQGPYSPNAQALRRALGSALSRGDYPEVRRLADALAATVVPGTVPPLTGARA